MDRSGTGIGRLIAFSKRHGADLDNRIGVTTQRFIYKRGFVWRKTQELQLRAIEEVKLEQGVSGRLFDFGHLELHGTGVDDIRLPALGDPLGLRRSLQDGMAAAARADRGDGMHRSSSTAA